MIYKIKDQNLIEHSQNEEHVYSSQDVKIGVNVNILIRSLASSCI